MVEKKIIYIKDLINNDRNISTDTALNSFLKGLEKITLEGWKVESIFYSEWIENSVGFIMVQSEPCIYWMDSFPEILQKNIKKVDMEKALLELPHRFLPIDLRPLTSGAWYLCYKTKKEFDEELGRSEEEAPAPPPVAEVDKPPKKTTKKSTSKR